MRHLAAVVGLGFLVPLLPAQAPAGRDVEFFEQRIRPVLVRQCYSCHSEEAQKKGKLKGHLLLDRREPMRRGGDNGPAVMPGKTDQGTLLAALRYDGEIQMPPSGKLPAEVIKDFETWVRDGAPDPREGGVPARPTTPADLTAARSFWAFQPPRAPVPPPVQDRAWPQRPLDGFILAALEKAGLKPAAPADRRTLIRRVTYDLTGLPPEPEAVEAFVQDASPDAYERLVDRLLASPRHGERWARLWLDLARYAEDQAHIVGNDVSLTYPNAYLFRDWVIGALNADLPYDQFVRLQLAADLIEGEDSPNLPALGFLGLGPKYYSRGSPAVMADEWEDRVDVVGRGLLGLTLACARCHDHKFDPIATADYYGLAGVFASTRMFNRPLGPKAEKQGDEAKQPRDAMHVVREGKPTDLNVFVRGDVNVKGPPAPRHFPPVLCAGPARALTHGSGRKDLADAIADPGNPLTARVIVNRVWAAYFGRGLVATPSNFGALGERPSHPELLDDLAVRFRAGGWSLKWLHREIVLSATYRQSSNAERGTGSAELPNPPLSDAPRSALPAPRSIDPENRLLGRMPRRRLGVEGWRDTVLAVTGTLDRSAVGGPSLDPLDPKERRRTVYSRVSRLELNRLLALFDFPDPNVTAERRAETTTPLQKLFVLNSPFMASQAQALADRLRRERPDLTSEGDRQRIDRAYRLLYGRPPAAQETALGLAFLSRGDVEVRWVQYAHVLLAANELLYLD